MKVKFLGAIERVTGSCTLLEYPRTGVRFLVDCGMTQGEANATAINAAAWPFSASKLGFVLLTHAHLDHCGLLPRLIREGFNGPVICTRFTAELAKLNLQSAAAIPGTAFTRSDVDRIQFSYVDADPEFELGKAMPVSEQLYASFRRTAHIGGSCSITVKWMDPEEQWTEMVFSGDLGPNTQTCAPQPLLAYRQNPEGSPKYLLLESTYGDKIRSEQYSRVGDRLAELARIIRSALERKSSTVVIPCFSIHRCQEVLVDLHAVLDGTMKEEIVAVRPLYSNSAHLENALKRGVLANRVLSPIGVLSDWSEQQRQHFHEVFKQGTVLIGQGKADGVFIPVAEDAETLDTARGMLRDMRVHTAGQKIQVLMDSPMAQKVTRVYRRELKRRSLSDDNCPLYRNSNLIEMFKVQTEAQIDQMLDKLFLDDEEGESIFHAYKLKFCKPDQSQELMASQGLNIVISSSGMCEVGPIVPHLQRQLPSADTTVILTGYADPSLVGGKLKALAQVKETERPAGHLVLGEKQMPFADIHAHIEDLSPFYSGHADKDGLLDFVFSVPSGASEASGQTHVFLNHGDDAKRQKLAAALRRRSDEGLPSDRRISIVDLPTKEVRWFDLDQEKWLPADAFKEHDDLHELQLKLLMEQRRTNDLLAELIRLNQHRRTP